MTMDVRISAEKEDLDQTVTIMNSCLKYIFVVFNLILLVGGLLTVGIFLWFKFASPVQDLLIAVQSSDIIVYSLIAFGCVIVIIGICGAFGGCYEKRNVLGIYTAIMAVLLIVNVGLVLYAAISQNGLKNNLAEIWHVLENDTKYIIQDRFDCCGYKNASEWSLPYPSSCINDSNIDEKEPWNTNCYTVMTAWFDNNLIEFAVLFATVILFQIFQIASSAGILCKSGKPNKVNNNREQKRHPRASCDSEEDDYRNRKSVYRNPAYENDLEGHQGRYDHSYHDERRSHR